LRAYDRGHTKRSCLASCFQQTESYCFHQSKPKTNLLKTLVVLGFFFHLFSHTKSLI